MMTSTMAASSSSSSRSDGGLDRCCWRRFFAWMTLLLLPFLVLSCNSRGMSFFAVVVHEKKSDDDSSNDIQNKNHNIRHQDDRGRHTPALHQNSNHHLERRRRRRRLQTEPVLKQQLQQEQTAAGAAGATATSTPSSEDSISSSVLKQGCLQSVLLPKNGNDSSWTTRRRRRRSKWRVCNSEDDIIDGDTADNDCRTPDFANYPEMRLYAQPWASSLFATWILQIILSELLNVPTTIETGYSSSSMSSSSSGGGGGLSLYDDDDDDDDDSSQDHFFQQFVANNREETSGSNNNNHEAVGSEKQALQQAMRYNQDCTRAHRRGIDAGYSSSSSSSSSSSKINYSSSSSSSSSSSRDEGEVFVEYYEPCAHYIPEIWQPETWMMMMPQQPPEMMMRQEEEEEEEKEEEDGNSASRLRLAPNGLVGQQAWYIPKFTAERDPSLLSYLGLQPPPRQHGGNATTTNANHRAKMAATFLTPTTWQYYCDYIAPRRCSNNSSSHNPDPIASRPPASAKEGARYFVPGGLYTGHFRQIPANDCRTNPTTCTGHYATRYQDGDDACWSSSSSLAQLHNDDKLDIIIALPPGSNNTGGMMADDDLDNVDATRTTGSNDNNAGGAAGGSTSTTTMTPAGGYQLSELRELWLAANATKSNVIMTWFSPETTTLLYQEFRGTDAEMVRVVLPAPANAQQQRLDENAGAGGSRPRANRQCSSNAASSTSSPFLSGVCDFPANPLQKLWLDASASSLLSSSNTAKTAAASSAALESPAHYVFESFHLSNLQLGEMIDYWKKSGNNDTTTTATTSPRQAICQWAADNIEFLESFIPDSYPRVISQQQDHDEQDNALYSGLMYACLAVGAFAVLVIIITGLNVADKKHQTVMQSAPLSLLFWILTGSLIVAVGGILVGAFPPSNATCTAEIWLVNVGFAIGFVPLIYKLSAIQRSAANEDDRAKRNTRVTPECCGLAEAVILVSAVIMTVLFLWSLYDPPRKAVASYQLTDTLTEDGETIVDVRYYCSSEQVYWKYLQVAWNVLLLLHAAVLGFVTANVPQDFNERAILTTLVHFHILFVLLWLTSILLSPIVDETTLTGFRSMNFSIDSIFTMIIYVFPKFVVRDPEPASSDSDTDSEAPSFLASSIGLAQPPLGPVARCIAYISGVSSCDSQKYQPVDSDDSALESRLKTTTAESNESIGLNDEDETLVVSQLRASVQQLEEERQELRSEMEKKNMALSLLEEEVGSLMEKLMSVNDSNVQSETADEMRRELEEEGRDLSSFFRSQDRSLKQLMSEEAMFLQKLESQRAVTDDREAMWDAVWRYDKENAVNRLYTWDLTTDEEMETGEI